jgi:hypothetical protein
MTIESNSQSGSPGPYILDAGISSTVVIARSWGVLNHRVTDVAKGHSQADRVQAPLEPKRFDLGAVVGSALRLVGLSGRK